MEELNYKSEKNAMFKSVGVVVLSISLISCSALMEEDTGKSTNNSLKKSNTNLREMISSAKYDVDNINIYTTPNEYIGKIISTRGIFLEQKFFKDKEKKFIVSGSNNGHPADYLVYLDHPLPKQTKIGENIQVISTASGIRVFGRLKGLEDYMTEAGIKKQLPVLDAIAIYNIDDRELQNPVWVNLLYK
jgi:hypothetical protein